MWGGGEGNGFAVVGELNPFVVGGVFLLEYCDNALGSFEAWTCTQLVHIQVLDVMNVLLEVGEALVCWRDRHLDVGALLLDRQV